MSLSEIIDQRIPFEPYPECPACGSMQSGFTFATSKRIRSGAGLDIDAVTLGQPSDPHLIITCSRCGLEREMETLR